RPSESNPIVPMIAAAAGAKTTIAATSATPTTRPASAPSAPPSQPMLCSMGSSMRAASSSMGTSGRLSCGPREGDGRSGCRGTSGRALRDREGAEDAVEGLVGELDRLDGRHDAHHEELLADEEGDGAVVEGRLAVDVPEPRLDGLASVE